MTLSRVLGEAYKTTTPTLDVFGILIHGIPRNQDITRSSQKRASSDSTSSWFDFHLDEDGHFAPPAHLVGAVGSLTKSVVAFLFLSRFGFDPFQDASHQQHQHRD